MKITRELRIVRRASRWGIVGYLYFWRSEQSVLFVLAGTKPFLAEPPMPDIFSLFSFASAEVFFILFPFVSLLKRDSFQKDSAENRFSAV